MQPVKKKRKKTQLFLETENISFHSQNKSLISENKPLSERVSEKEQLLQEIKAVQEKMKFERDFFQQKLKKKMKVEFSKRVWININIWATAHLPLP